jgi:hypothetical protein
LARTLAGGRRPARVDGRHAPEGSSARGQGYVYPHSDPAGFDVNHLPDPLKGRKYVDED